MSDHDCGPCRDGWHLASTLPGSNTRCGCCGQPIHPEARCA